MTQPTLINLYPNKYNQEFHCSFAVKIDGCVGSYNTLNDLSNKVCVPNKIKQLNLSVFNIITGINESITLTKYISCECQCRFDGKKCNSDRWWNNDKCLYECKKFHVHEKDYVWNPDTCNWENRKYFASIMVDSAIICDEIVDADAEAKSNNEAKLNKKKTNLNKKM